MTAEEAIALVRTHTGAHGTTPGYRAEPDQGAPEAWYVTATDDGRALIGGTAYVVLVETDRVFEVPASRPPHVNLREVRTQLDH